MPYIKKDMRFNFDTQIDDLNARILNEGDLTYIIYRLCLLRAKEKGHSYDTWKDIIGVLECAKLEIYRRSIADYEDSKIIANTDVVA